jgi:hypothetical protein
MVTVERAFDMPGVYDRYFLRDDKAGPFVLELSPLFRATRESREIAMQDQVIRFAHTNVATLADGPGEVLMVKAHDLIILPREGWSDQLTAEFSAARYEVDVALMEGMFPSLLFPLTVTFYIQQMWEVCGIYIYIYIHTYG